MGIGFFNLPISSTATAELWERPGDWVNVSNVVNNQINLVVGDYATATVAFTVTTQGAATYNVDWGDGTNDDYVSAAAASHNYASSTGGTACSEGYNTYKVVISCINDITVFNAANSTNSICILEANVGTKDLTAISFDGSGNIRSIRLPSMLHSITSLLNAFKNCYSLMQIMMPTSMNSCTYLGYAFSGCKRLKYVSLPSLMPEINTMVGAFYNTTALEGVRLPINLDKVTSLEQTFYGSGVKKVSFPTLPEVTTLSKTFNFCPKLRTVTFVSLPKLQNLWYTFSTCPNLEEIIFPEMPELVKADFCFEAASSIHIIRFSGATDLLTDAQRMIGNCNELIDITLPTSMAINTEVDGMLQSATPLQSVTLPTAPSVTNASLCFWGCPSLTTVNNIENFGSTTSPVNMDRFLASHTYLTTDIVINAMISEIDIYGCTNVTSIRLMNTGSTFLGSSPQINVSSNGLDITALVTLFGDLPIVSGGQAINITSNPGVTGLNAGQRAIATDKGWTIIS